MLPQRGGLKVALIVTVSIMVKIRRKISILSPISRLSPTREREIGKKSGNRSRKRSTRSNARNSSSSILSAHSASSMRSPTGQPQTNGRETPVDGYHCRQSGWNEAVGTRHRHKSLERRKSQSDAPYDDHSQQHPQTSRHHYAERIRPTNHAYPSSGRSTALSDDASISTA